MSRPSQLVECLIRRAKGTHPQMPATADNPVGKVYDFIPHDGDERHTAEVSDPLHLAAFLRIATYQLAAQGVLGPRGALQGTGGGGAVASPQTAQLPGGMPIVEPVAQDGKTDLILGQGASDAEMNARLQTLNTLIATKVEEGITAYRESVDTQIEDEVQARLVKAREQDAAEVIRQVNAGIAVEIERFHQAMADEKAALEKAKAEEDKVVEQRVAEATEDLNAGILKEEVRDEALAVNKREEVAKEPDYEAMSDEDFAAAFEAKMGRKPHGRASREKSIETLRAAD